MRRFAPAVLSLTVASSASATVPSGVFSPYVDMTLFPTYNLPAAETATGQKYYTLAFVNSGPSAEATWGGYGVYGLGSEFANGVKTQIDTLRARGGDVTISFGGASGQSLEQTNTNLATLTTKYQAVINAYGLTSIDFDVEGSAVAEPASIARRSQLIASLQQANPNLRVSLTLPVLPSGLDNNGLAVVQSAKNAGARIDTVNIMAMDYGDNAAPNPAGQMGAYAIQAATSTFNQLKALYPTKTDAEVWKMVGVTPMIGMNDVTTEIFTLNDAQQLQAFATQRGLGGLGMWSLNRDTARTTPLNYVDLTSSSIVQDAYAFTNTFKQFGTSTTPEPASAGLLLATGGVLLRRRRAGK